MSSGKMHSRRAVSTREKVEVSRASSVKFFLIAAILFFGTLALYWPALHCGFIPIDDHVYVTENAHIKQGLTTENLRWACTTLDARFWHPMTWLALLLDAQLYGVTARGFHFTNLLFHACNSVLLCWLFQRMTKMLWASAFVAALFAWHPLNVEPVVWISSRKDVLSTFFFLLTLLAYWRYVQYHANAGTKAGRPGKIIYYTLALMFFALGLLSKPMLVTLPFVLFLLDFWPLARMQTLKFTGQQSGGTAPCPNDAGIRKLIFEKVPFFVLSLVIGAITIKAQRDVITSTEALPLTARVGNAIVSYALYIRKILWPSDLAVVYPHPGHWPMGYIVVSVLILAGISALLFRSPNRRPDLVVGWLWFLGLLFPVIGLLQVGWNSMADRYTYISSIGIFVILVWTVRDLGRRWTWPSFVPPLLGGGVLAACILATAIQLRYWKDNIGLFQHALAVTSNNAVAENCLGAALFFNENKVDEAIPHFERSLKLSPDEARTHCNLGAALQSKNESAKAKAQYLEALARDPKLAIALVNLGSLLTTEGQTNEARERFEQALRLEPESVPAHKEYAVLLLKSERLAEATQQLEEVIRLEPNHFYAHQKLAEIFRSEGHFDQALTHLQFLLRFNPEDVQVRFDLGLTLIIQGKEEQAIPYLMAAIKLNPAAAAVLNELAWIRATSAKAGLRNGAEAVRLAERACALTKNGRPEFVGTLDAAYAEAGRFEEAMATAQKAAELLSKAGQTDMAEEAKKRIQLYGQGKAFHQQ